MQINSEWVILDCSNDSKLPEYNIWDGKNNCKIAVNYKNIFSPEESISIEKVETKQFPKLIKENKKFYNAINIFFENLRKHKF